MTHSAETRKDLTMTNDIEKLSTDLATRAAGIQVVDQASANQATELILLGKDAIKKIKAFFAPMKESAWTAHQEIVQKEKAELAKVEPVVDVLNGRVSSWRAEEQRKRDVAEAERLRIEREKQRLEEEAFRKAREAEEQAERERKRLEEEAERLERLRREAAKNADNEITLKRIEEEREKLRLQAAENQKRADEATNQAIDEAAEAEAALAPAPIGPEAPKTEGLAMRGNWCFEVVDPAAVPRQYMMPDEIKIGKVVRALKGQITIPGVRIFNRPIMVGIGHRNSTGLS